MKSGALLSDATGLPKIDRWARNINNTAFRVEHLLTILFFFTCLQIYYALYSFDARCANELSISANQRLRILEFKDMNGNSEWWLGEAGGRRGYVPSNYIRKSEYTWTNPETVLGPEGSALCEQTEQRQKKTNKRWLILDLLSWSLIVRRTDYCCWLCSLQLALYAYIYRLFLLFLLTGNCTLLPLVSRETTCELHQICFCHILWSWRQWIVCLGERS